MSSELLVLIVDDEHLDRLTALELTEAAGFTPIETGEPAEAVEALRTRSDISIVIVSSDIVRSKRGSELVSVFEEMDDLVILIASVQRLDRSGLPPNFGLLRKPYHGPSVVTELRRLAPGLTAPLGTSSPRVQQDPEGFVAASAR